MSLTEKLLAIAGDIVRLEDELAKKRAEFYALAGEPYAPSLERRSTKSRNPETLIARIRRLFEGNGALRAEDVVRSFPDYSAAVIYVALSRLRREGWLVRPRHGVYMVAPKPSLGYSPSHEPPGRAVGGSGPVPLSGGGAADEAEHAGSAPDDAGPGDAPAGPESPV